MRWVLSALLVSACSLVTPLDDLHGGDASSDAKTNGGLGQPCYQNSTCDQPLMCISGFCVSLGDASADSPSEASFDPRCAPFETGSPGCFSKTCDAGATEQCCVSQGGVACANGCSSYFFTCSAGSDCPTGTLRTCCLHSADGKSAFYTTLACPVVLSGTAHTFAECLASCDGIGPALALCGADVDCPNQKHCETAQVYGRNLGVCMPP